MARDCRENRKPASSKTGNVFKKLLLLLLFFFITIDFYVTGAIKVVLAQIQIYFKLNSGNKLRTVLFLDLHNEYFQPLQQPTYVRTPFVINHTH